MQQALEAYNAQRKLKLSPVSLPHNYVPREYQRKPLSKFFAMLRGENEIKYYCLCWHRRAGKDVSFFQMAVAAAISEAGDYFYMLPKQVQAKRVVWQGIVQDKFGNPCQFKDFIPPSRLIGTHKQEMRIEVRAKNGISNIYVCGSDNYDTLVGGNAKGVVFSEWSLCNPLSLDFLKPMINQNDGWILFCFTPRGKNHAYNTLVNAQKESNKTRWYVSMLDVTQTKKPNGDPVISEAIIQADIDDGMDESTIRQEYYLDFDAAIKAAVYGDLTTKVRADGRIYSFEVDRNIPVQTFWDIGVSKGNATSVWLMQPAPSGDKLRLVGYMEAEDESFSFFDGELKDYANKHGVKFGKMYFPHDGKNREWIAGKKRHEEAIAMGYDVIVLPRITDIELGIRQTRKIFDRLEFHEIYCGVGFGFLERYRRKIHKDTNMKGSPIHDESSNAADALRQIGQFYADKHVDKRHDKEEVGKLLNTMNNPMVGNKQAYDPFATDNGGYNDDYDPFAQS
ncbi:terminase large subunit [Vibrio phage 282E43-1]|nr:terminase large subunit [Vibrio phage 284E43-1]CAH9011471.1 terminase large subunit [Vibrio phage 416E50-1]CAH9015311.1 terminase large subunit [Vibrio phage 282E43-1]